MYKVFNNLLLFLANTIFYIYVFSVFSNTASDLLFSSLVNFSSDLSSIGFPFTDSVSSNFVVFLISFFNTIFIVSFIKLDFNNSKIEELLLVMQDITMQKMLLWAAIIDLEQQVI